MGIAGRIQTTRRVWFSDPRTPLRRMSVSTHPSEGVAVVSLWQGQTCTGTFRLPLTDAAGMIAALADGMAAGLAEPVDVGTKTPRGPWDAFLVWVRRQFSRRPSDSQPGLRILK
jgi:hypothetical protein